MKFNATDFDALDDAVSPLDTCSMRDRYVKGDFPRADAVQDLDKRYRWDLLWMAADADRAVYDILEGYNTDHIDTVLRALVSPLPARS